MLVAKTYLDRSIIDGIGLFAQEFIPKGTIIYYVDPIFTLKFTKEEYKLALEKNNEFVLKYFWKEGDTYFVSLDNDRFINHSNNPNTIEVESKTIAKIDINVGEEITSNYNDFCDLGENF